MAVASVSADQLVQTGSQAEFATSFRVSVADTRSAGDDELVRSWL